MTPRATFRVPERTLARPQRPDFHHLLTLTAGDLRHVVDFDDYALRPGSWLWGRPGQVQQWGDLAHAEGTLILFRQDVVDPATAAAAKVDHPHAPVVTPLVAVDAEAVNMAADPDETYLRFRDAVERHFTSTRRVEDHAHLLGYSGRTLSRATLAGAGIGAKEFIDRRVVLEAKRLPAHSDESAAQVGAGQPAGRRLLSVRPPRSRAGRASVIAAVSSGSYDPRGGASALLLASAEKPRWSG